VTETSKESRDTLLSNSVTAERNRLMSWGSTEKSSTKPVPVVPSSKITIILRPHVFFVSKITKLILSALAKVLYTLLKLAYEVTKLFMRLMSSIRRIVSWPSLSQPEKNAKL